MAIWGLGESYRGSVGSGEGLWGSGEGTLSHLDIWDTPEPFEVSLQEAINIIWVKLSQLEEGMGPVGTPTQESHLGEPLGPPLKGLSQRCPHWTPTSQGPPLWAPPSWRNPQGPHPG